MKLNDAFGYLNGINCNEHTEQKNGLTYLSWAWAWQIFKTAFPASRYTVYEDANGRNYFTDGQTAWVKTGVVLVADDGELELIEMLPVMDFRNKSIPVNTNGFTSFEVNKSIQRSLTKALARHGLGLYIYAGEDLPHEVCEGEPELDLSQKAPKAKAPNAADKPSTVKASGSINMVRINAMREIGEQFNIDGAAFTRIKERLAGEGKVADKPYAAMTDDEFAAMLAAVSRACMEVK